MRQVEIIGAMAVLLSLNGCLEVALVSAVGGGVVAAQERSVGDAIDDAGIHAQITNEFLQNDVEHLFADVHIEVDEGRVLLTGDTVKPEAAAEATRLAWKVKGVKEVINEIQVVDEENWPTMAKDIWIEKQIEGRLLITRDIHSINYDVEVVNGIAYLMGIARSETELGYVIEIARRTRGVKQVVNHVRLRNDPRREIEALERAKREQGLGGDNAPAAEDGMGTPPSAAVSDDGLQQEPVGEWQEEKGDAYEAGEPSQDGWEYDDKDEAYRSEGPAIVRPQ